MDSLISWASMNRKKKCQWSVTLPFKNYSKYDVLRNHSRYDFGNSCASKRRELHSLPIGWKKKKTTKITGNGQERMKMNTCEYTAPELQKAI